MAIPLTLQAPPLFDRSLVPAYQTNFNRIRDAFGRVMGSEVQSGTHTQAAIGATVVHFNVGFPASFSQPQQPHVVVTPIGVTEQWLLNVGISTPTFFSVYAQIIGGVAATANLTLMWQAWYS